MARGTTAAGTGRGAHVSLQPSPKGPKASALTVGRQATTSTRAPMSPNQSQKTTTAPAVSAPPILMVRDTKARTAREQQVDAYNRANPAHSGGTQQKTMLEREKAEFATASGSGSAAAMPGRKKQAQ